MDFQLIAAPPLYFQVALNLGETARLMLRYFLLGIELIVLLEHSFAFFILLI